MIRIRLTPNAWYSPQWASIDEILHRHGRDRNVLAKALPPFWPTPILSAEELVEPHSVQGKKIIRLQIGLQSLEGKRVPIKFLATPINRALNRRVPLDFPELERLKRSTGLTWVALGLDNYQSGYRRRAKEGGAKATLESILQAARALHVDPFKLLDVSRLTAAQQRELKSTLAAAQGHPKTTATPTSPPTALPPHAPHVPTYKPARDTALLPRLERWRDRHWSGKKMYSLDAGYGSQIVWFQLFNIIYECLWVPFRRGERSLEDTMLEWCTHGLSDYRQLLEATPRPWRKYSNPALHVGDRRFQDLVRRLAKPGRTLSISAARRLFEEFRFE